MPEEIKTFTDLLLEIRERGLCGKCGGCVSFCSSGELHALEVDEEGYPRFVDKEKCLHCGICYLICPQVRELDEELREKFGWQRPIGLYRSITSAQSIDPNVHKIATDGGVVTSLLLYMLDHGLIDSAIVSRRMGVFGREPTIATTREEIIDAAGSGFAEAGHIEKLGYEYTTFSPTVTTMQRVGARHLRNVCVVGTPCQITTIRKMQLLGVVPSHTVKYCLGLFCMENFSFNDVHRKRVEKNLHFNLDQVKKLNIKDDLIVTMEDGDILHIPFEEVDEIARPACLICTDFTNEFSDISLGGLGSPDGFTTLLTRTKAGEKIFTGALRSGYIKEKDIPTGKKTNEKTKLMAKVVSFARRKKERAENKIRLN